MLYLGRQNRAILSAADKIGRFLHETQQIFVGRFCRQMKSPDFVVRLTSPLESQTICWVIVTLGLGQLRTAGFRGDL